MTDEDDGDGEEIDFLADLEELAAHLARDKAIAHLKEFFPRVWDPESEGPPALDDASSRDLAFYLLVADRWDDLVEYLQAIWDRTYNDVPARGDDMPRTEIGSIHGIVPPADGADTWELSIAVEDSDAIITHAFKGWVAEVIGGVS
jgi:hypothetical protein